MEESNKLLSLKIEQTNLYLDLQSVEETTNRKKPKYKLSRAKILDQYLFNLLTKTDSGKSSLTLIIKREDWLNIASHKYLSEPFSYCDITKCIFHSEEELLAKIKDIKNGLPFVAKLKPNIYNKLLKLCKKAKYIHYLSDKSKKNIELSLQDIINEKLKKLHLD